MTRLTLADRFTGGLTNMSERMKRLLDKIEEALDTGEPWPCGEVEGDEVTNLCQEIRADLG